VPSQISFTFDTWTSETGDPYLSITAHYISAHEDRPQDWELRSEQLAFVPFEGNHSGANMANVLVRTVDRYGIREKVCTALNPQITWSSTNQRIRQVGLHPITPATMIRR
jgi:hypothetical protein